MRLLSAVLMGALVLGGCGSGSEPVAGPSSGEPTGSPSATASPSGSATVACDSTATPDQPGDPEQARPDLRAGFPLAAMDPTAPQVIAGEATFAEGAGAPTLQAMWAFDVCTNTWQKVDASVAGAQDPLLEKLVTDPAGEAVLGFRIGLAPVLRYDPVAQSWSSLAVTGGGSDMAVPMVVHDPDGEEFLAFDANLITEAIAAGTSGTGVLALRLDDRAWTAVDPAEAGDRPRATMQQYAVAYDSVAKRLILVITPPDASQDPAQTWAFDPQSRTWSRVADVPRTLAGGYPGGYGFALAFDPVTARTWAFGDTAMLGYDAVADDWVVAERDAGWPDSMMLGDVEVDPTARIVGTMIADPVNQRLVVIGGEVRRVGDQAGGFIKEGSLLVTDDVWAYDPAANTWTMLLGPSGAPATFGPG